MPDPSQAQRQRTHTLRQPALWPQKRPSFSPPHRVAHIAREVSGSYPHTIIIKNINLNRITFNPARYNVLINFYNLIIIIKQRANINLTSFINKYTLVDYITKYYIKIKKKSLFYNELIRKILFRINSRAPLLSLILKLINKLLIKRDQSI